MWFELYFQPGMLRICRWTPRGSVTAFCFHGPEPCGAISEGRWTTGEALGQTLLLTLTAATLSPPLHLISLPPTCGPHGRQPEAPVGANAPTCLEYLVRSVQTADWEMGAERKRHFFKNLQGVQTRPALRTRCQAASSRAVIYHASAQRDSALHFQEMLCSTLGSSWRLPSLHNSQASVIGQAWVT